MAKKSAMSFLGTDIVETSRIKKLLRVYGERFVNRILTPQEYQNFKARNHSPLWLAGRWAAKEAAFKALGAGAYKDFEILNSPQQKPVINFYRRAKEKAQNLKIKQAQVSISHCHEYALAVVLLEEEK